MRRKARRSLEAARLLLAKGYLEEAASRLYFALFQAGIHGLEQQGKQPADFRNGAAYGEHRTVAGHATRIRGRQADADLFLRAMRLRVMADYNLDPVDRRTIEFIRREVERFVLEVTT